MSDRERAWTSEDAVVAAADSEATRATGAVVVTSAALLDRNPQARSQGWVALPSLVLRGHTPVEAFALAGLAMRTGSADALTIDG